MTDTRLLLCRAIRRAELESILELGRFTNPPGLECKYFTTTTESAQQYAEMAQARFNDGPYVIVVTSIDPSLLRSNCRAVVDRGIDTVVIVTDLLERLASPTVLRTG